MNKDNIEEILNKLGAEEVPREVCKIAEETSRDFNKTLAQKRQQKHYVLGEHIMKSRIPKLAVAAAVIILVVLAGLPFLGKKGSGIVLADVLAKVEQAKAFMYKMKMNMSGSMMTGKPSETKMDFTITISKDYGMKCETETAVTNAIMIMPEMKKYMQMEFDDEHIARTKKQNNDPREMIKQIMGCQYNELGRSVIDGKEVEGFHTTDPEILGGAGENIKYTLWVDAKSWLPVRCEMDFKMGEQMQASSVIYDYQWDIAVDASDFEPVIPEDFTPISSEAIKMPSMTEEAAIEGLKYFVELCGQYPKKLDMLNLMQEFAAIQKSREPADTGFKSRSEKPEEMKPQGRLKETMEMMRPVQSLAIFYMSGGRFQITNTV